MNADDVSMLTVATAAAAATKKPTRACLVKIIFVFDVVSGFWWCGMNGVLLYCNTILFMYSLD